MKKILLVMLGSSTALGAEPTPHKVQPEKIIVTANPLGSSLFDHVTPVNVMDEKDLERQNQSSLGEALNAVPGISSSYFGPNASRPVIRGQEGDRIRIMENGIGSLDASAVSPDHATTVDPMILEQIEVVRGPAALLYGGSAVGGVVNTINNRIPSGPIPDNQRIKFVVRRGGADKQKSEGILAEAGNQQMAFHIDGFSRRTENLAIPGFARSKYLRNGMQEENETHGIIPNSSAESKGGAIGASTFFAQGFAGLSYSGFQSLYGTVAEEDVRIDLKSSRVDFDSELKTPGSIVEKAKVRVSQTQYLHTELEGDEVGTRFKNRGYEGTLELSHLPTGFSAGTVGLQVQNTRFSALGDEAFLPPIQTRSLAGFIYEEIPLDAVKLSMGARLEKVSHNSEGGGPDDVDILGTSRFGSAEERNYTPRSLSVGGLYTFTKALGLSVNVSSTQRAPTYSELFANGPHLATDQYEIGNRNLEVEKSLQTDINLRWKNSNSRGSAGLFYNRFKNYIVLLNSGLHRAPDGTVSPAEVSSGTGDDSNLENLLQEARTTTIPADFYGFEFENTTRLIEGTWSFDLGLKGDYLFARNRDDGKPLPRIAPYHVGISPELAMGAISSRLDVTYSGKQSRVYDNEIPTDAYTMVDLWLSYQWPEPDVELFVKGNNLLNQEARVHSSVLKDIAPLAGRGMLIGIKATI